MEDFKNSINLEDTLSRDLNDLPGEEWKEIKGYEGKYLISNYSRVKSIVSRINMILKKTISSGRYQIILHDKRSRKKSYLTGRLVAIHFIREPKINEVLKYRDKNYHFDAFFNLEWIAKKDSSKAAFSSGSWPHNHGKGFNNGMTKLKANEVVEIRQKKAEGLSVKQLSDEYKVAESSIQMIIRGRRWNNI
ncbi:NUMOD4 domain-containing protein [Chryseobacterium indoltheticum]|uniref:NUMOD4 motif n=1 Tax=Chryseobacterium indoltheticum TaxID=254 RepID=A0A381FBP0_9FLAO|nr:NUMOD4 domain-containing protein [Chryseobacterium indoltheticum]AZA73545.1 hypothetical protein EG358_07165 [Chryseobacterium indoltheticum]SIR24860.1 NUMOD4 motif-containing protein [Chryseobacterium indoltheticum]SUX43472.1 NUMOD4 motif [Chryseobacterium indoltheticum]